MKRLATLLLLASATQAFASSQTVTRPDDPSLYLPAALGKQVDVCFSEAFAKGRLAKTDFGGVVMSELPGAQVCLFGRNQGDPYPVLRQFRVEKGQGPERLLPALKAKGLVLDNAECQFAPYTDQTMPKDDIPEPPCGELGMTVDSIGFFMISTTHPERILYASLGQDGTMFDPYSIKLF